MPVEYRLHDNAFDDDPFRLADLPFDAYYLWETISSYGPSGGVEVGGHVAAANIKVVAVAGGVVVGGAVGAEFVPGLPKYGVAGRFVVPRPVDLEEEVEELLLAGIL
jgi:hypothetical protein